MLHLCFQFSMSRKAQILKVDAFKYSYAGSLGDMFTVSARRELIVISELSEVIPMLHRPENETVE